MKIQFRPKLLDTLPGYGRAGFAQDLSAGITVGVLALPLAMIGLVTPWMAGIGMSGSSLLVVLNSLRLQASSER